MDTIKIAYYIKKPNPPKTSKITFSDICVTCLSRERKLTRLCDDEDGITNLFFLLSCDSEAYEQLYTKEVTDIYICWECKALMNRLCKFREQACIAQKQLYYILNGVKKTSTNNCLSMLSKCHQNSYDYEYTSNYSTAETDEETISVLSDDIYNEMELEEEYNYDTEVDVCEKPSIDKSIENDDSCDWSINDKKVMELKEKYNYDTEVDVFEKPSIDKSIENDNMLINDKKVNPNIKSIVYKHYTVVKMTKEEMLESIRIRRLAKTFHEAEFKCETCIEVYCDDKELQVHRKEAHMEQENLKKCKICQTYVKDNWFDEHISDHYLKYQCHYCDCDFYHILIMLRHLKLGHAIILCTRKDIYELKKVSYDKNPGLRPWLADPSPQGPSSRGYACSHCDEWFDSKLKRSVHIFEIHKPFKFECEKCRKTFRNEIHLKYHKRYECMICKRIYRHLWELNDHMNYKHLQRTHYKCPICRKAFASNHGVNFHVKYVHEGKKKKNRKIKCQTCGKAISKTKKSIREHALIHSGEKPLSCNICGRPFRQSAALYMHKRRVHKMALKPQIKHVDD